MSLNIKQLLDVSKLGKHMLLVESPEPFNKFINGTDTGELSGYKYQLVLSEFNWDKIMVKVEQSLPIFNEENFKDGRPISVIVEGLEANPYVQNNRVALSFKAKSITLAK